MRCNSGDSSTRVSAFQTFAYSNEDRSEPCTFTKSRSRGIVISNSPTMPPGRGDITAMPTDKLMATPIFCVTKNVSTIQGPNPQKFSSKKNVCLHAKRTIRRVVHCVIDAHRISMSEKIVAYSFEGSFLFLIFFKVLKSASELQWLLRFSAYSKFQKVDRNASIN